MQTDRLRATWPFQALADDTRFRVTRLLASVDGAVRAGALAQALEIAPSHLTRHLQVLEAAGIAQSERVSNLRLVRIRDFDEQQGCLLKAVAAMADESGLFAQDLARLTGQSSRKVVSRQQRTGSLEPLAKAPQRRGQPQHVSSAAPTCVGS